MTRARIAVIGLLAIVLASALGTALAGGRATDRGSAPAAPSASSAGRAESRFVPGICQPRPCAAGPTVSFSIATTDSSARPYGFASSPATVTTRIDISRPANLSAARQAPAVIVTCMPAPDWLAFAPVNAYVYVKYNSLDGPGMTSPCDYQAPATAWHTVPSSHAQLHDCGASGSDWCDGIPGLVSTIHAIECTGAPPCENVNPHEVYVVGSSEAGLFAQGAICDTRSSHLVAGVQILSDILPSPARLNRANPPSDRNALSPNCPAILGVGRRCLYDCVSVPSNRDLAIQWVWGSSDGAISGTATNCPATANCVGTGLYFRSEPDFWFWGDSDLARRVIGHRALGCSATPASVATSGYTGKIVTTTYTHCANPRASVQTVQINGGGHIPDTWPLAAGATSCNSPGTTCINGSDGLSDPAVAWAFWTHHP